MKDTNQSNMAQAVVQRVKEVVGIAPTKTYIIKNWWPVEGCGPLSGTQDVKGIVEVEGEANALPIADYLMFSRINHQRPRPMSSGQADQPFYGTTIEVSALKERTGQARCTVTFIAYVNGVKEPITKDIEMEFE